MRPCLVCKRTSYQDLVYCDFCGSELGVPPEPLKPKPTPENCPHDDVDPGSELCNACGFNFGARK
jgi:hypothetical protein